MAVPPRRPPPPSLDSASLERLALRYVERFATTRGKLAEYLRRKVRERGWDGPAPEVAALAERMAELGYVNDRAYAEAKAVALTRRGLGARRVGLALRQAHVGEDDAAAVQPRLADEATEAALAFARRKRIGPFGDGGTDRALREKQLAQLLRAGHPFELARRIVVAAPGDDLDEG